MVRHSLLFLVGLSSAAAAEPRAAPSRLFADDPGLTLDIGAGAGINDDDMATDFDGTHSIASLLLGYRFHTGTQAFATAGLGVGGHEAIFASYGAGLRQHVQLGRFEPFVDAGLYEVGDGQRLGALGLGVGVEARIDDRFYVGASANRFFSADDDEIGGLDWGGRLYVGTRLGASYR